MKKALAALLALALLVCAVPFAFAQTDGEVWLLYCADADAAHFTAMILAPAKYTALSDAPQIETVYTGAQPITDVLTPAAERIRFYFDGKTETRWMFTVTGELPDGAVPGYDFMYAVLPGSVLDGDGNRNARVYFDDGTEYRSAWGYAEIEVYSSLLRRDYGSDADTVAVGDVLRADYSGLYPAEVFINGEKAAAFAAGEMQRYMYNVTGTGTLSVEIRQDGKVKEARRLNVITSQEMYERNLRDGLITGEDIPGTEDLVDVGVPAGSPFILLARIAAFFNALRIFFERLFSFPRITG